MGKYPLDQGGSVVLFLLKFTTTLAKHTRKAFFFFPAHFSTPLHEDCEQKEKKDQEKCSVRAAI